jgi:hypothetical protein
MGQKLLSASNLAWLLPRADCLPIWYELPSSCKRAPPPLFKTTGRGCCCLFLKPRGMPMERPLRELLEDSENLQREARHGGFLEEQAMPQGCSNPCSRASRTESFQTRPQLIQSVSVRGSYPTLCPWALASAVRSNNLPSAQSQSL